MSAKKPIKGRIVVVLIAILGLAFYGVGRDAIRIGKADAARYRAALADPAVLVLGFPPSAPATEIRPDADKLAAFLSDRLGRPVEVLIPTTQLPLIEGLRSGQIQAAFLDSGTGWIAHQETGAEVILAVREGPVDLASGSAVVLQQFLTPDQQARIQELLGSGNNPAPAVLVARELAPGVVAALRDALLTLNEPANLPLLRAIYGANGLEVADTEGHFGEFGRELLQSQGGVRTIP